MKLVVIAVAAILLFKGWSSPNEKEVKEVKPMMKSGEEKNMVVARSILHKYEYNREYDLAQKGKSIRDAEKDYGVVGAPRVCSDYAVAFEKESPDWIFIVEGWAGGNAHAWNVEYDVGILYWWDITCSEIDPGYFLNRTSLFHDYSVNGIYFRDTKGHLTRQQVNYENSVLKLIEQYGGVK
jgi:hypothetical protein